MSALLVATLLLSCTVFRCNVAGNGGEWKVEHHILQRHMLRTLRCGDVKRYNSSFPYFSQ